MTWALLSNHIQNFLAINGITLTVIFGWLFAYKKTIVEQRRTSKMKAYEVTLAGYWEIYGDASEDKFDDSKFYQVMASTTQLEIWAPEFVVYQANIFCDGILKLIEEHNLIERQILQKSCLYDYYLLVNMLRVDLGLPTLSKACFDKKSYTVKNEFIEYKKPGLIERLKKRR